ncbi:MAG TPA: ABC transporter permease [Pseudonocardiaceae bacterium]|jgi:peptide/nickel transport system permease protein
MTAAVTPPTRVRADRSGWLAAAFRSRYVVAGLAIIAVFTLVALVGPYLVGDPAAFGGTQLAPPSGDHWLGTTQTGQDVFTQLVVATRDTLAIGALAALAATCISVAIGVGGGFAGGTTDDALSLVSNVVLVIPQLPLVILIAAYVRHTGIYGIVLVIALTSWAASARILRAQTLSLRGRDYVLAARAYGERPWRIIVVELMPNELPIIVSQFIYAAIAAILTQSSLSFLGLADPSQLTWGNMLFFAQNDSALASGAWWWFVPPGLCIALVGTGLAMANFGLDEFLNPRLRRKS